MTDFVAWPKTPRWNRKVIITEKIDGTNGAIIIEEHPLGESLEFDTAGASEGVLTVVLGGLNPEAGLPDSEYWVFAQSRKRLISPGKDNFGFATWVVENAVSLVRDLGPGRHYGEWYGKGIQRGYSLDHKRFALFNTIKWADAEFETEHLGVVPVLAQPETPSQGAISDSLVRLRVAGSKAVRGYMNPEGIVIFHTAANQVFKVLLDNDAGYKAMEGAR